MTPVRSTHREPNVDEAWAYFLTLEDMIKAAKYHPAPLPESEPLVKQALARRLCAAILSGEMQPGERIVEATWGRKYGVAQASIREAIHLLTQDGFVTKASGRSARVVSLSQQDVLHLYQLRAAIEGLAARLAVEQQADTTVLASAAEAMRLAAEEGSCERLLAADLDFHLELCRLSGNPYIAEHARRILLPLFAFVQIKISANGQQTSMWDRDLEAHRRMVELIEEGDAAVAELYVQRAMNRFAQTAHANWNSQAVVFTGGKKERRGHLLH